MHSDERGFTLVEMLISMLILVLVTGMLLDGLHLITHHVGYESAQLDRSSQTASVQNFLRTQLTDAQPVARSAGSRVIVDFTGRRHHLAFVSPASASVAFGGFQRLSINFDASTGDGGGTVQATWQSYRAIPVQSPNDRSAPPERVTNRILLDHVAVAAFSYFGSIGRHDAPAWHQTWQEMADLPMLVRLSVVFTDGRVMPQLIVALRVATPE